MCLLCRTEFLRPGPAKVEKRRWPWRRAKKALRRANLLVKLFMEIRQTFHLGKKKAEAFLLPSNLND